MLHDKFKPVRIRRKKGHQTLVIAALVVLLAVISNVSLLQALPAVSGCNSPHDCTHTNNQANNLTCDYTSSTCRACRGAGEPCDPTRFSYSECCKDLDCYNRGNWGECVAKLPAPKF